MFCLGCVPARTSRRSRNHIVIQINIFTPEVILQVLVCIVNKIGKQNAGCYLQKSSADAIFKLFMNKGEYVSRKKQATFSLTCAKSWSISSAYKSISFSAIIKPVLIPERNQRNMAALVIKMVGNRHAWVMHYACAMQPCNIALEDREYLKCQNVIGKLLYGTAYFIYFYY